MKKINEWINQKSKAPSKEKQTVETEVTADGTAVVKQSRFDKEDLKQKGLYAGAILLAGVIGYNVIDHIKQPDSVSELMPMMDDAREFDSRASDISMAYGDIEDDVGSDAYFTAIESTFVESTPEVEYNISKMQRMDTAVKNSGGVSTYEDLQKLRKQPNDPIEQQRVEKAMKDYGIN